MVEKYQLKQNAFSVEEAEKIIYETVRFWLDKDSSDRIIEQFRYLFIKGHGYESSRTRSAIEAIVNVGNAREEFNFIFSRCCQLIITEWQPNPILRAKIPLLINQIALAKAPSVTQSRNTRKLRELVADFTESEQYLRLQRISDLIVSTQSPYVRSPRRESHSAATTHIDRSVNSLLCRYPYLYEACLLGEDSSYEYKETVSKLKKGVQNRYELDLSRYITYRVRLVEIVRKYKAERQTKIPKKIIQPVSNPTIFSDRQLDLCLRECAGKIDSQNTIRSLAFNFRDGLPFIHSHSEFKIVLLEYLMTGLDCEYSKATLETKLARHLDSILPDLHANKVDDFTLLRTCSLLLKFLVVDSIHRLNHYLFVDMISQLGVTKVASLLLKIILICEKAKPYLEQRLSILFTYYGSFTQDGVQWLVEVLETMQVAISIHFGKVDLSLLKIV